MYTSGTVKPMNTKWLLWVWNISCLQLKLSLIISCWHSCNFMSFVSYTLAKTWATTFVILPARALIMKLILLTTFKSHKCCCLKLWIIRFFRWIKRYMGYILLKACNTVPMYQSMCLLVLFRFQSNLNIWLSISFHEFSVWD